MRWPELYKMMVVFVRKSPFPRTWLAVEKTYSVDEREIHFQENGAGSLVLSSKRTIRQVYKNSRTRDLFGKIIQDLVTRNKCIKVMELGTSIGMGTRYLSQVSELVITVEGCENTANIASEHFTKIGLTNVQLFQEKFDDFLKTSEPFDLVYIDGHHEGKALQRYVNRMVELNPNCIFICDDIRWNFDMKKHFKELKKAFTFHADFYQMGVLSNRPFQF